MKTNHRSAVGFFLIELLIVISIIALVATFSVSYRTRISRLMVQAELMHLHSLCLYYQQVALATGQEQKCICDTDTQSIRFDQRLYTFPQYIKLGFLSRAQGPPAQPIHPINKAVTFPGNTIHFYPDGTISSGTIYIIDQEQTTMYALTSPIGSISTIRMYRYTQGKWVHTL